VLKSDPVIIRRAPTLRHKRFIDEQIRAGAAVNIGNPVAVEDVQGPAVAQQAARVARLPAFEAPAVRVDGKCVACAGGEDRATGIPALRVAPVLNPVRLAETTVSTNHLAVVPIIMWLLVGEYLRPAARVADDVHALANRRLTDIQLDWRCCRSSRAISLEFE